MYSVIVGYKLSSKMMEFILGGAHLFILREFSMEVFVIGKCGPSIEMTLLVSQ